MINPIISGSDVYRELTRLIVRLMSESPKSIVWTWDTIKGFGRARVLKTSYIFLFIVPVLARVLINIPASITISFWDKPLVIPLALPFSWVVLFVSACLASLGNVIYAAMCPQLVKQFTDFPAFKEAERDGTYLRSTVHSLALLHREASMREQVIAIKQLYNPVPIKLDGLVKSLDGEKDLLAQEFYFIRDSVNLGRPALRLLASFAYFGAFTCLGIIVLQNVTYVVEYFAVLATTS